MEVVFLCCYLLLSLLFALMIRVWSVNLIPLLFYGDKIHGTDVFLSYQVAALGEGVSLEAKLLSRSMQV